MNSEIEVTMKELNKTIADLRLQSDSLERTSQQLLKATSPYRVFTFTPPPMVPLFLHNNTIDSVICKKKRGVSHFAWMRGDQTIEVNAFDVNSKEPWKQLECEECVDKLRATIDSRGFLNPISTPTYLNDMFLPPNAPFTQEKVIVMTRSQDAPIYNYAWIRSDTLIELMAFNVSTMHWMASVDKDMTERMKMNIWSRGYRNQFLDDMPNPWNPTMRVFYPPPTPQQLNKQNRMTGDLSAFQAYMMQQVNQLIDKKLEPLIHKDLCWMPSVEQVKVLYRTMIEQPDRVSEVAKKIMESRSRKYSEEELNQYDQSLVCLYVDDPFDCDLAVKILMKCAEAYVEEESEEQKYERMTGIASKIFDEAWKDGDMLEDSGASAEGTEEQLMRNILSRIDELDAALRKAKDDTEQPKVLNAAVKNAALAINYEEKKPADSDEEKKNPSVSINVGKGAGAPVKTFKTLAEAFQEAHDRHAQLQKELALRLEATPKPIEPEDFLSLEDAKIRFKDFPDFFVSNLPMPTEEELENQKFEQSYTTKCKNLQSTSGSAPDETVIELRAKKRFSKQIPAYEELSSDEDEDDDDDDEDADEDYELVDEDTFFNSL